MKSLNRELIICNIDEEGRFGGPERRIINVSSELKKFNIKSIVLMPIIDSNEFSNFAQKKKIIFKKISITRLSKHFPILIKYIFKFIIELFLIRFEIIKSNCDIVHINGVYQFKSFIAALLTNKKIIWHLNDTYSPNLLIFLFRLLSKNFCNGLISTGRKPLKYYVNYKNNIPILYTQPPITNDITSNKKFGWKKENQIIIGNLSSFNPAKDLMTFVKTIEKLSQEFKIKAIIAGPVLSSQMNYYNYIKDYISRNKLSNCIEIIGQIEDVGMFFNSIDICLLTSKSESGPTTAWECIYNKVPLVTTNVGSIDEFLVDGESALISKINDHLSLAKNISLLITQPDLKAKLIKNAKKIADANFYIGSIAKKYFDFYQLIYSSQK